ncbi:UDP-N-acetylmuramoyl-L-alanyl-D-glutamate--2,6-diaminopimelate ligase [Kineosporia sp. NBRC 101677]|uniref:UDP-N-acetylmuramoyl-L-alanyl-D-glutamate--2, 6-diaminopimelate ligase n=1 Tax=Kineosporia sp. NBRC 101677 TaxID=3032197 RepID=UPI0024A2E405|nr:UDP-N-acetylmuramoyl-L-alanyl-D-glutamate--2,6-diaminopimelate ligase [Kineosporia sp. NBRC 101677]GLY18579.1 UDP-N-acetylmuramoyl-L-alanyl-D-glutamate--2,6-diaminopimelate ligase [Kineosporia sp. NBRC 101677]
MPAPLRDPAPARSLADVADVLGTTVPEASRHVAITGVCLDSRAIRPGDLYAALPGARTHGARFASGAAQLGATAVLTDPEGAAVAADSGLPLVVVPNPREVLGALAAWVFGAPAEKMLMFGVTGTNGKTTTTFLLDGALRAAGRRCGLIGTVLTRILDEQVDSVRTTPEAPDLAALMALMVARGVQVCSMEVSSHAVTLGRVDGIRFDVAGFTNLSQDHLDFHPTMEDYFAAKAELFTPARSRQGVICVDDAWGSRLAREATVPVVTFTTAAAPDPSIVGKADWSVTDASPRDGGTDFVLTGPDGIALNAHCPLPGDFNVANTVLALLMLVASGTEPAEAARLLAAAPAVPGRMEQVGAAQGPLAVVDYAHTPDAVATALKALRPARSGPLVVVLGAGGDRDRAKRPKMGAEAARHADLVVVTDDNPRSEVPAEIRASVLEGARSVAGASGTAREVLEVPDRREAIATGVRLAGPDGIVLVTGKGHERGQEIAGVVHPFDDRSVLAAVLEGTDGSGALPVAGGRNR